MVDWTGIVTENVSLFAYGDKSNDLEMFVLSPGVGDGVGLAVVGAGGPQVTVTLALIE